MKRIGIVYDPKKSEAKKLALEVAKWLKEKGHKMFIRLNKKVLKNNHIDMIITFGGDGTVLHAANLVVGKEIPIARVNFGKEGFLTNIEPHDVYEKLLRVLGAKDYTNHVRTRLEVSVFTKDSKKPILKRDFLNDVVIERVDASVISAHVRVGHKKYDFVGDAFVLAPRTGSTAYHESAGGRAITREDKVGFKVVSPSSRDGEDRLVKPASSIFVIDNIKGKARLIIDGPKIMKRIDGFKIKVKKSKRFTVFMEIGDAPRMNGD